MSDDNGSSNGGGNTSVFWEVRHGSANNPKRPGKHEGSTPPPRGNVKVDNVVEGHTDHNFSDIGQAAGGGKPDHPGLFKVVLRFRNADWNRVLPDERRWLENVTTQVGSDRFLTVHVPAIERAMPGPNGKWAEMPWEIHWEW